MNKLLALLLTGTLLFSLTACGGPTPPEEVTNESTVEEQTNTGTESEIQDDTAAKVDDSKTLKLYYDIFSGPYTLNVETYIKDFENPDNKMINGSIYTVVDGTKKYNKITSITGDNETSIEQLLIDDYNYHVYHESKQIIRTPIRQSDKGTVMVMAEEDFYTDLIGEPGTKEIFGKEYYSERFSAHAETVTYCYEGDELKYIVADSGGVDIILGVLELKKGADSSYFELPEDYDKNY